MNIAGENLGRNKKKLDLPSLARIAQSIIFFCQNNEVMGWINIMWRHVEEKETGGFRSVLNDTQWYYSRCPLPQKNLLKLWLSGGLVCQMLPYFLKWRLGLHLQTTTTTAILRLIKQQQQQHHIIVLLTPTFLSSEEFQEYRTYLSFFFIGKRSLVLPQSNPHWSSDTQKYDRKPVTIILVCTSGSIFSSNVVLFWV